MREEEKLANNAYKLLGTTWAAQTRVFTNIANSEASHTEAIRQLLVRYTLADPAAKLADGVFQNQTLQQLYNSLIAQGTLSYIDALKVGCAIEEIDILDLQNALVGIDNQDITVVYNNLNLGSRNHLRSFVKALTWVGITYVPQYLSPEAYLAIVSTPIERGNWHSSHPWLWPRAISIFKYAILENKNTNMKPSVKSLYAANFLSIQQMHG